MDHFAGLDVSVKDTSVCIVDGTGEIVRELKVATLARRVALISAGDLPGLNGVIERDDFPLRFRRQP